jgi:hypothetical protein
MHSGTQPKLYTYAFNPQPYTLHPKPSPVTPHASLLISHPLSLTPHPLSLTPHPLSLISHPNPTPRLKQVPLTIRVTTEDDVFQGFKVPRDTILVRQPLQSRDIMLVREPRDAILVCQLGRPKSLQPLVTVDVQGLQSLCVNSDARSLFCH